MIKNIENMAIDTLTEIWSQIDWDKVTGQRAIGIWDEFSSKVKASSMTTNSYEKFVEKLCRKMDVRSLRFVMISDISTQGEDVKREILKLLREQTQIIVLKLRLNNQIRKEQQAKEKETKLKQDKTEAKINSVNVKFTDEGVKINAN
ncbi:MAG: hypothetical protein RR835_12290 [Peptostreptococcaceae bacterium]